eukprot:5346800-Amphidinium_carterae.1
MSSHQSGFSEAGACPKASVWLQDCTHCSAMLGLTHIHMRSTTLGFTHVLQYGFKTVLNR